MDKKYVSLEVGRAALRIAITANREEEQKVKEMLRQDGIKAAAVDFGGEFMQSITKIIERAVVASERENLVADNHVGSGSVAGAAQEALDQVKIKAMGFNVGGKIGIARYAEHVCVTVFMGVGVLNFNEQCVGLAHRTLPISD